MKINRSWDRDTRESPLDLSMGRLTITRRASRIRSSRRFCAMPLDFIQNLSGVHGPARVFGSGGRADARPSCPVPGPSCCGDCCRSRTGRCRAQGNNRNLRGAGSAVLVSSGPPWECSRVIDRLHFTSSKACVSTRPSRRAPMRVPSHRGTARLSQRWSHIHPHDEASFGSGNSPIRT